MASIEPSDFGIGLLFWTIREGVVVVDLADERVVLWNPATADIFGYTAEEAIGQKITAFVPDRLHQPVRQTIASLRDGAEIPAEVRQPFELAAVAKDGRELRVELTLSQVTQPARRPEMRCLLVLVRDVTERTSQLTRSDVLLQVARRCAAESDPDRVLRMVLASAVGLVGADDGGIARWDPDREELVQVQSYLPSTSTGTVLSLDRSASGRAAVSREPVIVNDYAREGDPSSPAAKLGIAAGLAVPLVHEARLLGTLSVSTARTDKKFTPEDAATLELLASIGASALVGRERARLEGALAVRNELMAEISHDLKTPLAAAHGQVQLLQRALDQGTATPERLAAGLSRLAGVVTRMALLIDELRDLAILQSGQPLELTPQPTDLVGLVRERVAEHQGLTGRHRLRLETREATLIGHWDAVRLARVVDNLLDNAVKFSPGGGEIVVSLHREGGAADQAVLAVRDRGIGIPAGDLPRIFDRFARGANVTGRVQGSGIGLAGARHIVEQHGGSISVESSEAHGSTFTIRLPLSR